MKHLIVSADDFGLSDSVNEAVEQAHRDGVLTSASLMVAAPASADAVRRARDMPRLAVGLHLVAIEGQAVLPPQDIPDLVDRRGWFSSAQLGLGLRYGLHPSARRQLAAEIRAQFAAFAATGLRLDHANAHKHMHMHPTVGRLLIDIGRDFGLPAIRVPAEPPLVLAACGERVSLGNRLLFRWSGWLRRQAHRAGLLTNDYCIGIAWSGGMTAERLLRLPPHLPDGIGEIYLHPASRPDPALETLMPDYQHTAELAALLDADVRRGLESVGQLTCYGSTGPLPHSGNGRGAQRGG
ncbi:MAG: hopanoid biosynthesis-associated protein HpnK [Acetobacteraceae bacterium]